MPKNTILLIVLFIELVITLLILLTATVDLSAFLIGSLWVSLPLILVNNFGNFEATGQTP